jgi:hypothetical protein
MGFRVFEKEELLKKLGSSSLLFMIFPDDGMLRFFCKMQQREILTKSIDGYFIGSTV